jgi:proline dehydrogenase
LSAQKKQQESVLNFFSIDLRTLPDTSFELYGEYVNNVGRTVQRYFKTLDYKELGLFDVINVKHVNQSYSNITFVNNQPDKADMKALEEVINDLYRLYGEDEWGKGKFTRQDYRDYFAEDAGLHFVRSWLDEQEGRHRVLLGRDNNRLFLKICDVGLY